MLDNFLLHHQDSALAAQKELCKKRKQDLRDAEERLKEGKRYKDAFQIMRAAVEDAEEAPGSNPNNESDSESSPVP